MAEILLGIDVGSSSVKACAFDRNGDMLGKSSRPLEISHPCPLWAEMDAEMIWREVTLAVREAVNGVQGKVVGIGVSSACPTTVFMDEFYAPLRPAVLYLDHRSMEVIKTFCARFDAGEHFAAAGNRPGSSTSWLANLPWVKEHEPDIWKRVRCVSLLSGFLATKMTGDRPVVDWTQASYSGGFHVADPERGWDDTLLAHWGIDKAILANVGWSCLPAGTLKDAAAIEMGIEPGAVIAYGTADTAASAFALGMKSFGDVFESSGTSGVITFCLNTPRFDDTFMNRCHIVPGRWLAHGAMSTLGGAFSWLRKQIWPEIGTLEELQRLAGESSPGANGVVFLPYLAGERSPIWDPEASGMWVGLRIDHNRRDLVRAVFEGTAFGLKQIIERGKKFWECNPTRLLGVGGGARNMLWAEIKSDILGVEYLCADEPDAAAWGAALVGGIAAGVFQGVDDPSITFIAAKSIENAFPANPGQLSARFNMRTFERKKNYDNAFSVYEMLYPALKGAMHLLTGNTRTALE